MTMLITKPPTTNGYNTIATGDANPETTATVPRVPDCRSTWTTTVRSGSGVMAMVAGMLLLSAGGGTVWRMRPEGGSSYHPSSGSFPTEDVPGRRGGPRPVDLAPRRGLVVAAPTKGGQCVAAHPTEKFSGLSFDPLGPYPDTFYRVSHPFETCWKRYNAKVQFPATYCWSRSTCYDYHDNTVVCFGCSPKYGSTAAPWYAIKTNDVVNGCTKPCEYTNRIPNNEPKLNDNK